MGVFFPFWKSSRSHSGEISILFKCFFHMVAHSFALTEIATPFSSGDSAVFAQNHPGRGTPLSSAPPHLLFWKAKNESQPPVAATERHPKEDTHSVSQVTVSARASKRVHNFNPGPGALPLPVLERIREELLDWRGSGMSVMEMSHRSPEFESINTAAEQKLRNLLGISDDYAVIFVQGDRKSTRLNSSHRPISYAVFCLKKKKITKQIQQQLKQPLTLHKRPNPHRDRDNATQNRSHAASDLTSEMG